MATIVSKKGARTSVKGKPKPAPTVTGVSPNSGDIAGGVSVTITGTNFTGAASVKIGGVNVASFVVVSSTSITAVTPVLTAGVKSVSVTTSSGTGTGTNLFTAQNSSPSENWTNLGTGRDADGWTTFTPNGTIYYVSTSGSDSNDGLSSGAPFATIAHGVAALANGSDDQLLLKCGDTFVGGIDWLNRSGASVTHPIVVGSYGAGAKPIIDSRNSYGVRIAGGGGITNISNVAFIGLDFYASSRDPSSGTYVSGAPADVDGFIDLIYGSNILIEGCTFRYYKNNILIQGDSSSSDITNVILRRNVVVDSYSVSASHSQGMYLSFASSVLIEQNYFDHNGWNETAVGGGPTIFNHNMYFQYDNAQVTVRENISSRASSHGLQQRAGGSVTNCLFLQNPINLLIGNTSGFVRTSPTSEVTQNVLLEAIDGRGVAGDAYGIDVNPNVVVNCHHNIIANTIFTPPTFAIQFNSGANNNTATNNIIYHWGNSGQIINNGSGNTISSNTIDGAGYPSPSRTIETYDSDVLGGPGTIAHFSTLCRAQSKANWNVALTADAVNDYIRAGFGL